MLFSEIGLYLGSASVSCQLTKFPLGLGAFAHLDIWWQLSELSSSHMLCQQKSFSPCCQCVVAVRYCLTHKKGSPVQFSSFTHFSKTWNYCRVTFISDFRLGWSIPLQNQLLPDFSVFLFINWPCNCHKYCHIAYFICSVKPVSWCK